MDIKELQQKFRLYTRPLSNGVLKMDAIINQQVDCQMMMECAEEFIARFAGTGFNKILTIETGGISIAALTAFAAKVPMVYAKKRRPITMQEFFEAPIYSFTNEIACTIRVDKSYLSTSDRILFLDDMLANGSGAIGAIELCRNAGAKIVGLGFLAEKRFQGGYSELKVRCPGVPIESLVVIKSLQGGKITFEN